MTLNALTHETAFVKPNSIVAFRPDQSASHSFLDHSYYYNRIYDQLAGALGLFIVNLFWGKISIVYCCHCRAHSQPISWTQSCPDIQLIHVRTNCALRGRKQIWSSGKWWWEHIVPKAEWTALTGTWLKHKTLPAGGIICIYPTLY